jgi:arylsulfatase A-like enzyme
MLRYFKLSITVVLLAGTVLFTACQSKEKSSEQPNIIFIMSDDHAWQALSAYGHPLSKVAPTPQIDRLAEEGMLFDRCLVTNSICGPSRATLLTGTYSHYNGMYRNGGRVNTFDPQKQTFPKLLQEAGYKTAMIGKWHLPGQPSGFDHWDILPGQGQYYNPSFISKDSTYRVHGYVSDIITDKSLEWLKKSSGGEKPFLLLMHHKAPHRRWEPGPKYLDSFDGVIFPEPATLLDENKGRGTAAREQDMSIRETMQLDTDLKIWTDNTSKGYQSFVGRLSSEQQEAWENAYGPVIADFMQSDLKGDDLVRWKYQRYMNDYLACIKSVDESVGRVLDYLEQNDLDKNTLVVYTSDQGFFLGEHGWFDKRFMYEESYRTPLLIRWKGHTEAGSVNKEIVSNLDFAETFLDVAGVDIPEKMQGESLKPLLKGKTPKDWRKEHYYHYYEFPGAHMVKRHYGIATDRYKLMHFYYDIDEWEMYDLENDPDELTNVYNDPDYVEIREELHVKLDNLMVKYDDSKELRDSLIPD